MTPFADPGDAPGTLDVSVVIVTYANAREIEASLRSLEVALEGLRAEIIVVDNDSPDETTEVVRASGVVVRLVVSPSNVGFARAVNAGARLATGRFLLLLNPDARVRPSAVEALLEHLEHRPQAGIVGGRIIRDDGTPGYESCWGRQTLFSLACFATGASTAFPRTALDPESLGRWPRDTVAEVDVVTGLLLLVGRRTWETLGGFDEDFWLYGEDADLGRRAWEAGWRPTIVPAAEVEHDGGASSASLGGKRVVQLRARVTLLRKHHGPTGRVIGTLLLLLGVAIRAPGDASWAEALRRRGAWTRGFPVRSEPLAATDRPTVQE